jgi:hypothetical protein
MLFRRMLLAFFGIVSAVAGAVGLMLLVLWAFDNDGLRASLPELLGAAGALVTALGCRAAGHWLRAREAADPALRERAV